MKMYKNGAEVNVHPSKVESFTAKGWSKEHPAPKNVKPKKDEPKALPEADVKQEIVEEAN